MVGMRDVIVWDDFSALGGSTAAPSRIIGPYVNFALPHRADSIVEAAMDA